MRNFKRYISGLLAILILVVPLVAWANWPQLSDWWKLRGYNPPAPVLALAAGDTMTGKAKHIFYVNHPQVIASATSFRKECPENEQTIVLGCYHPGENGIAVYAVADKRLDGVQEVTAAHEMLHAAYERLSSKDKNYVDGLLENYYRNGLHDQRIIKTMDAYKKSEPNDVVNEMHSVFGTEIAQLPKSLETYYQQYFSNRSKIAAFASGYEAAFTGRVNQINTYDQQLAQLRTQIQTEQQSLQAQSAQVDADRQRLDSLRKSGQAQAYNSSVAPFNAEVETYNTAAKKLQSDIETYNDLVDKRNALAADLRSLDQALDTRVSTQSVQ